MVPETGEGLSNADSLIDLTFLDAHCSARGYTTVTDATTAQQEIWCVNATDWLRGRAWIGYRLTSTQSLDFPREIVNLGSINVGYHYENVDYGLRNFADFDTSTIPLPVKQAVAELVYLQSLGVDLFTYREGSAGLLEQEDVAIGPLRSKEVYKDSSEIHLQDLMTKFGKVEAMISNYVQPHIMKLGR